jgi:hypothetical protein
VRYFGHDDDKTNVAPPKKARAAILEKRISYRGAPNSIFGDPGARFSGKALGEFSAEYRTHPTYTGAATVEVSREGTSPPNAHFMDF